MAFATAFIIADLTFAKKPGGSNSRDLLPCIIHDKKKGCHFKHRSSHKEELMLNKVLIQEGYAEPDPDSENTKHVGVFEEIYAR